MFSARLRGAEEVPPVSTNAKGKFFARLLEDGRSLAFTLEIEEIRNAFVGHIHLGRRGVNGPIVVFLFGPLRHPISVRKGAATVTGTITRENLVGPLQGHSLRTLIRQMRLGNAYVNVHTRQNPNGEMRGQIRHR
ncbi:CHRD domain-containing protein [Aneurinibacillus tyrosinisolvens]|uniref:CHRD domain-containing protein n=1 Tax=Aneurinibacillus tyrosinisolvens TaxID=1443435 RepID=UPI00156A51F8|nr:CHRD domain-containing protein [Aneurinibacillus tyrosinisolvens]